MKRVADRVDKRWNALKFRRCTTALEGRPDTGGPLRSLSRDRIGTSRIAMRSLARSRIFKARWDHGFDDVVSTEECEPGRHHEPKPQGRSLFLLRAVESRTPR